MLKLERASLRLRWFKGVLGKEIMPDYRFGTELAKIAKAVAGLKGIIHSDELPGYGITEREVEAVRKELKVGNEDGFVLVAAEWEKSKRLFRLFQIGAKLPLRGFQKR